MAIFSFIPKLAVFKSLTQISVCDILTNNFKVNPSQRLKPKYRIPMKNYFEEICFYYDISNDKKSTIIRHNSWSDRFMLIVLLFNFIKSVIHVFWNEQDKSVRLYGGNLEQFFSSNSLYYSILEAGATLYCIASFCLFQYLPVSQLNWLKVFNPIEGKETFVKNRIFMGKSAKNFIRITLILIIFSSLINHITPLYSGFYFMFIPLKYITFKQFILFSFPWTLIDTIWVLLGCYYFFVGLNIILIICYYYELRLNQLDIYVNLCLKRKKFNQINKQIGKILVEYVDVINEMNQLNKFVSKLIFSLLFFCSSTLVFLIYNMIYVKIDLIVYTLYILFCGNVGLVIVMMIYSTVRIASKFHRNKRNLMKFNYITSLSIQNRIKVSSCDKITIKFTYLSFSYCR